MYGACGAERMAATAKFSLRCPCFSLSRWLPSVRSFSSRQWTQPHLQRVLALASIPPRARSASSNVIGLGVGFVAKRGENVGGGGGGGAWKNSSRLSGLGLRSENYTHAWRGISAIETTRARFCTRRSALHEIAGEGHGGSSESFLDTDATGTDLVSRTVAEPAAPELQMPSPERTLGRILGRKRMCYYFSQGLCTLMEDEVHMSKFTHEYPDMSVRAEDLEKVKPQPFSYFLVLDLEGMVEILEFPVLMLDAKTLQVVDRFHRFVRPCKMSEKRIEDYIRNKYGKWGLERVWHDTAIPFADVLPAFEAWLESHGLFHSESPGKLKTAAFVTCGNWDVKTKMPEQCVTSEIELPPYFNEWINLKDIYVNFYKFRAAGMLAMMKGLKMRNEGTHHVGLDDAHNIARVLQRMLAHGAVMRITGQRGAGGDPKAVKYAFKFRIK